ncbi:MAG: hypothetical protein HY320_01280 [Armatimonadetes bacterium]|nr:hypothetical protein [Armatimonadota bacterium]
MPKAPVRSRLGERYVVDEKGNPTEVILPLERFVHLLEDLHDLAIVAERHHEESVSWDETVRRLKEDGLLSCPGAA